QERSELKVDMLVATADKEVNVFQDAEYDIGAAERLGLHPRAVAVVDAVMPALEDLPKPVFQAGLGGGDCLASQRGWESIEAGDGDSDDAPMAIGMNDPGREQVAEELLAVAEELVEERLHRRQTQDGLALHHLSGRHAPPPVDIVGIGFKDG